MNLYIHSPLDATLSAKITEAFGQQHTITFRPAGAVPENAPEGFLTADAILGNPPIAWFNDRVPAGLKLWQLDSAGFDQYRVVKTNAKVANMGDWFAWPCAETIVGGVLALYRGLPKLTLLQKERKWIGQPLREELHLLHHKSVVILGAGTIGMAVKSIVQGFGASVQVVARSSPQADIHSREELLRLLPSIDLVINTLPGAAGIYVDKTFLESMKSGSVYANVGRGTTTDEAALIDLLQNGHLSGAVLDVTEKEPLPGESPLWGMPNVILTQHTGGGQFNENAGKASYFIENLSRFLKGEELLFEVDLARGY